MYQIKRLTQGMGAIYLSGYQLFSVYPYNQKLEEGRFSCDLIYVGIECNGRPIGLGVAEKCPIKKEVRVITLYISSEHRNKNLGTQLLAKLEEEVLSSGSENFERLTLHYPCSSSSSKYVEKILRKQNWIMEEDFIAVKMLVDSKLTWLNQCKSRIPSDIEIIKWSDLKLDQRKIIKDKGDVENWYPPSFSPFQHEDKIELSNSLVLLHRGNIAGWLINHRFLPDVITYSTLFVTQLLEKTSIGMYLVKEALKIHASLSSVNICYGVSARSLKANQKQNAFRIFFQKKIYPHCTEFVEFKLATKYFPENKTHSPIS